MSLKFDIIGESCFIFDLGSVKLITDPWFGEPIYLGAWTQFPIPQVSPAQLYGITHIFISHVHADHCCISSLSKIIEYSPSAQFVIMDREASPCFLSKKLISAFGQSVASKIIKIKPYKKTLINGIPFYAIPPAADNSLNELVDSSLAIISSLGLILFSNDNAPCSEHATFINNLPTSQYLALIPFSGGSGYPATYENISSTDKDKIALAIRDDCENFALTFLRQTRFRYFMPVAGNHVIAGKSYDYHKTTSFLLNPYQVLRNAKANNIASIGFYSHPAAGVDLNTLGYTFEDCDHAISEFDFQRRLFIESISQRMAPLHILHGDSLSSEMVKEKLASYGLKLSHCLAHLRDTKVFLDPLVFICSGPYFTIISAKDYSVSEVKGDSAFEEIHKQHNQHSEMLAIDLEATLLAALVARQVHINELDAACLLRYYRTMPYVPELYAGIFSSIN